jgi:hypothetical protein
MGAELLDHGRHKAESGGGGDPEQCGLPAGARPVTPLPGRYAKTVSRPASTAVESPAKIHIDGDSDTFPFCRLRRQVEGIGPNAMVSEAS